MNNWSVDTKFLKRYPKQYALWKMEQLINFGLGGNKISRKDLKQNLNKLKVDPLKKRYLKFLLSQ